MLKEKGNLMMESFNKVMNVDYVGHESLKELRRSIPLFILEDKSAEEWNVAARRQNIKMFIEVFNRQPVNYDEVSAWILLHNA